MTKVSAIKSLPLDQRLAHYLTQYDIRQQRSKYYNPFALGIYLERAERVANEVSNGERLAISLERNFSDRILAMLLKKEGLA